MSVFAAYSPPADLSTIPPMGSPQERGHDARMAILRELLRRKKANESAPTWRELALVLPEVKALDYHLRQAARRGLVLVSPTAGYVLTDAGKALAETLK